MVVDEAEDDCSDPAEDGAKDNAVDPNPHRRHWPLGERRFGFVALLSTITRIKVHGEKTHAELRRSNCVRDHSPEPPALRRC